jgi:peptide-methionine (S)-S-oxide reductase
MYTRKGVIRMKNIILVFGAVMVFFGACAAAYAASQVKNSAHPQVAQPGVLEKATFAGGCFWCMEHPFDELPGVVSVTSGYTGGQKRNPTYKDVSAGGTGHAEAVQVVYDPAKVGYEKLLAVFWHNIDPTAEDRQFCDSGDQYRSAIFFYTEEQRRLAVKSKEALEKNKPFRESVVTEITKASEFYPAEEYHQHYYKKNPIRYKYYRTGCGRDHRLKELWGKEAGH